MVRYVFVHARREEHSLAFGVVFGRRLDQSMIAQVDGSYLLDDKPIQAKEFKRMSGYVMQVGIVCSTVGSLLRPLIVALE